MLHEINIHRSNQGIMTIQRGNPDIRVTVIHPNIDNLSVGDHISSHCDILSNDVEMCLMVTEIKEIRKAKGVWKEEKHPFWAKIVCVYDKKPLAV